MTVDTRRAFIDDLGAIVPLPDLLPAVTVEQAEEWLPAALDTLARLKRLTGFLEEVIREGWVAKKQREGLIGGTRYVLVSRPTPYVYDAPGLFDALRPFIGKVITQDELIEATGWTHTPARTIPETVSYDVKTAKLDAIARRSEDIAQVINAHRSREEGEPALQKKK